MTLRMRSVVLFMSIGYLVNAGGVSRFPAELKICSAKDPNINDCFRESANIMFPYLAKGMEELGMVPIDPLSVPLMGLQKGNKYLPGMTFNMTNTTHLGWRDAKVLSARVNPDDYTFDLMIFLPLYQLLGDYDVEGRVLFIDITGNGKAHFKFYNNTYNVEISGEPVTRDGELHMDLKSFSLLSQTDKMEIKLDNLFNNKLLSDATNRVLNWNSKTILDAGTPATQELYGEMYSALLRGFFDKVPYKQMFTDLK